MIINPSDVLRSDPTYLDGLEFAYVELDITFVIVYFGKNPDNEEASYGFYTQWELKDTGNLPEHITIVSPPFTLKRNIPITIPEASNE